MEHTFLLSVKNADIKIAHTKNLINIWRSIGEIKGPSGTQ